MNAKAYLNQVRLLDLRINTKLDRIARLRALAQKVTATTDGEIVNKTRNISSLQDQIIRLMEEEESLNRAIDQLINLKKEVSEVLTLINDPECELLLELRYLCYRGWDDIAGVMNYHLRTVHKIHGHALQKLNEALNSEKYREIHEKWAQKGT